MTKDSFLFTLILAGLGVLPPLSIDLSLPALAIIASDLHTTDPLSAMTLSLFLLGYAVAPLFCGPLSDRYGRRPILLLGCSAFTLGAAGCALTPNITVLLICRVIQGLGSGAATVLSTALIRDLFEGHEARSRLAQIGVLRSFAPMIAPTLGAFILTMANWRYIYALLTIVGSALLLLVKQNFAESAKLNKTPFTISALLDEYSQVFKHRQSFGYALMNALYFGALFTYVTNSPLLMIKHFGLSKQAFGLMFAGTALGIMCGAFVSGKFSARKLSPKVSINLGLSLACSAASINILLTYFRLESPQTLFPGLFALTFSAGLLSPATAHGCIEPLPKIAGVVSAVMACSQMIMGAIAGIVVSYSYDEKTSWAMTLWMMFYVFASASTYLLIVKPAGNVHGT